MVTISLSKRFNMKSQQLTSKYSTTGESKGIYFLFFWMGCWGKGTDGGIFPYHPAHPNISSLFLKSVQLEKRKAMIDWIRS